MREGIRSEAVADAQYELLMPPLPVPLTTLVGRRQDLDSLITILLQPQTRLATVTGPGGVGKTRLAIEAAGRLAEKFAGNIAFVPLAGVTEPDLVVQTVAAAIGVQSSPGPDDLQRAIGQQELLLVLDNFEHLLAAAPAVATLLVACPGVTALVTSRERLRIRGEREYPLQPLRLPAAPRGSAASGANGESPAVTLFVERVRDVRPGFTLQPDSAGIAVEICRRLDGLPLAIELAAARSKVLPLPALLNRLEQRLPLLTDGPRDQPARQQTLERTIAWSYALLSPEEQRFFRHLAVFVGGFGIEAAEAVTTNADGRLDILDSIASLVDKSLLRQDEGRDGEARFVFLETVREYGLARLAECGETAAIRRRHAQWVRDLVVAAWAAPWEGQVQRPLLDRFEDELGNLRAALEWLTDVGDATAVLTITGLTSWFWITRSYRTEGRSWLERGLAMPGAAESPAAARALACFGAASLARTQDDRDRAFELATQSLGLYRDLGDRAGTAASVLVLGSLERGRGNLAEAAAHMTEAVDIFESGDGAGWLTLARYNLGVVRLWQEELEEARRLLELALTDYRANDDSFGIAYVLIPLSLVASDLGDLRTASAYLTENIARAEDLGTKEVLVDVLFACGVLAAAAAQWNAATRILAASQHQADAIRYTIEVPERALYDRAMNDAREALDSADWSTAQGEGRVLTLGGATHEAAALLAVLATGSVSAGHQGVAAFGLLSPREHEVIRLIADGMSDRQIGEALFISHRTVMRHVANILAKLDLSSRGAASAWYTRQNTAG